MVNVKKLNEVWKCIGCSQLYITYDNAINCCTPTQINEAYKCRECGDIYENEEVAEECCKT